MSRTAQDRLAIGTPTIELRRESLLAPVAQQLISALNAELQSRYPEEGANFFHLDPEEVSQGRGAFFIAYMENQPVGCGAVRRIENNSAEIKRMYVDPVARGRSIARRILAALEEEAVRLGLARIVLETGPRQPEAIALYRGAGFVEIPLFGEYVGAKFSVCMAKDLSPA